MGNPGSGKRPRRLDDLEAAFDVPEETPEYPTRGDAPSAINPRKHLLMSLEAALTCRQNCVPCTACGADPECLGSVCPYL